MAEWSKALVLGISLFGGVGSNPTALPHCCFTLPCTLCRLMKKQTQKKNLEGYIHEQVSLTFFPVQFSFKKLFIRFKKNKKSSVILCSYAPVPANALDRYLYFPVLSLVAVTLCLNMVIYVTPKFVSQINQFAWPHLGEMIR